MPGNDLAGKLLGLSTGGGVGGKCAFAEGGYVGMQLLVAAMQKVRPNLTRANLKLALDAIDFASPLTLQPTLTWRPGSHFSNATMQAWEMEYKGSPAFWRAEAIAQDPNPAQTARDAKYDLHRAIALLAHAYANTGWSEKADALFQQATQISTSSETYFNYATFLASQNRIGEAREWAERILAKKPTMPRYLQRRERPWFRKANALLKRLRVASG